ncbi:MAG: PqiB family protein [Usitatibacter sp.]
MAEEIPQALARKPGPRSLQIVWIVPFVAAIIGGWLAVKSFLETGPMIAIQFQSAEGIEVRKTKIKHNAVDIGTVKSIRLSKDRKSAIVTAEMAREVSSGFLVADTQFWVVRPRIAGGQVSGLGTLLAGSYIGADPGKSTQEQREFVGLETPPPVTSDLPGRQFALTADDLGSLDVGSPVYYRGVVAGRIVSTELPPDGKQVLMGVFVHAPYDKFVNADTRFWNASGVDLTVDAGGAHLQTQSLVTLLVGGIAFEAPAEAASLPPADAKTQFPLWDNRAEAFKPRETVVETYVMKFTQSVRGLSVGAPVDFRGIVVGEVKRIDLEFDPATVKFRTAVEIHLFPERLRSRRRDAGRAWSQLTPAQRMERFVERGFRGQLRSANLLTGQLYVALDFFDKETKAAIDMSRSPPEIPTVAGGLGELQESLANIVNKLEKVPFDAIGEDLRKALVNLSSTLKKADALVDQLNADVAPELKTTLEQARKTLGAAESALSTDSPLQGDLRETLNEVRRAAESTRNLVDYLERHPESLIRGKREGEKK